MHWVIFLRIISLPTSLVRISLPTLVFILEVLVDRDCKISDFHWGQNQPQFDNTQSKKNTEEWSGSKSSFNFVLQFLCFQNLRVF